MSPAALLKPGLPGYPALLSAIVDAPRSLYVRGALGDRPALAIVGSRRPTPYGLRMARRLSRELAASGLVIVSGLARGIDTAAHEGALEAGGVTWAVLGSGLDRLYPPENKDLAARIVASAGAVLSEFAPEQSARPEFFPQRNRIISGLSAGTLVIEGDFKSGSLITAKEALKQGREVFAVPGPADSPMSEGPNFLIKEGATPVTEIADLSGLFPFLMKKARGAAIMQPIETTQEEKKILKLLGSQGTGFDRLAEGSGICAGELSALLTELELKNLIIAYPGQNYAKR